MAARREFRIGRFWLVLCVGVGGLLAAAALALFSSPWTDSELPRWFAMSVGATAAALSLHLLSVAFGSGRYAVEMTEDGLRMRTSSRWVSWSEIARLVERPVCKRVDLLGYAGQQVASLEYQLEDFGEALERVLVGTGIQYATTDDFGSELRVDDEGLTLHGEETLPWTAIEAVRLGLRVDGEFNHWLDVAVEDAARRVHWIRPAEADPFALVLRIRQEWRARVSASTAG